MRDRQRCWFFERDFGGHVLSKRSYTGFRKLVSADFLEDRCEVLVDSERDVKPMIEFST